MPNATLPLWQHSRSAPERTALYGTADHEWDYATLGGHIAGLAARLRAEAGIMPGDRVLLIAPSTPGSSSAEARKIATLVFLNSGRLDRANWVAGST